jgi:hypothetical protein
MSELVNKVANSGLITLDLEPFLPTGEVVSFDLKEYLFMGLILKEKDFREALKNMDLTVYENRQVALFCSADAIIPVWAYMLVTAYLEPVARLVFMGTPDELKRQLLRENIAALDTKEYLDQRVVVKGCGATPIPDFAYAEITRVLRPVVKSIMYGEPCSTVPVYKKKP